MWIYKQTYFIKPILELHLPKSNDREKRRTNLSLRNSLRDLARLDPVNLHHLHKVYAPVNVPDYTQAQSQIKCAYFQKIYAQLRKIYTQGQRIHAQFYNIMHTMF